MIACCENRPRGKYVEIANASVDARRWGKGVKLIALGWLVLFFSAWLHGEITTGFAFASMASGVYWTIGSFLESAARVM
jgi:hypothetical protein